MPNMQEKHAYTHKVAAVDQGLKDVPNGEENEYAQCLALTLSLPSFWNDKRPKEPHAGFSSLQTV